MVEILKSDVQEKIGVVVKDRGDCQFLSDVILVELGETVNYNTLRRFFGVDKKAKVEPSKNTLNTLARFLGYSSYNEYAKLILKYGTSQFSDDWFTVLDDGNIEGILSYLKTKRLQGKDFEEVFIRAIRELILFRRIEDVITVFESDSLRLDDLNYSTKIYVGNAIGILLRELSLSSEDYALLIANQRFVRLVLSIFVDYSGFNKSYGELIKLSQTKREVLSKNARIFFECVNYLRLFMLGKTPHITMDADIERLDAHPILVGRVTAINILKSANDPQGKALFFQTLKNRFNSEKVKRIDYFYEVKIIALLLADFELMHSLQKIQESRFIHQQYQISQFQLSCLIELMLAVKNQDRQRKDEILKQIKRENWVKSYYDFFELFLNVGLFHSMKKGAKNEFKKGYLKASQKMGCSYFDEKFLLNYFNHG